MSDISSHSPGRPNAPPPDALVQALKEVKDQRVRRVGLTSTSDGNWAAMVWVSSGTATPIPEVDAHFHGYPVVYVADEGSMPIARPAFPDRGE